MRFCKCSFDIAALNFPVPNLRLQPPPESTHTTGSKYPWIKYMGSEVLIMKALQGQKIRHRTTWALWSEKPAIHQQNGKVLQARLLPARAKAQRDKPQDAPPPNSGNAEEGPIIHGPKAP